MKKRIEKVLPFLVFIIVMMMSTAFGDAMTEVGNQVNSLLAIVWPLAGLSILAIGIVTGEMMRRKDVPQWFLATIGGIILAGIFVFVLPQVIGSMYSSFKSHSTGVGTTIFGN